MKSKTVERGEMFNPFVGEEVRDTLPRQSDARRGANKLDIKPPFYGQFYSPAPPLLAPLCCRAQISAPTSLSEGSEGFLFLSLFRCAEEEGGGGRQRPAAADKDINLPAEMMSTKA